MWGRKKKPPAPGSFRADVAELRAAIWAKVRAGRGTRSLIEALQEQAIRQDTVQAAPTNELEELLRSTPPGERVHMSAEQYRELMKGKK